MRRPSQVGRLVPPLDRPGCVLLDLRMPGASGLELQAALTRRGVALPVIFLTDHGDVASSVRAMQAGAADYLTKPVKRDTLFEVLRRALAMEKPGRGSRAEFGRLAERLRLLSEQ